MKFETEILDKMIGEISKNNIVEPNEIPDIDLYIDQVTTFMENKFAGTKRSQDDKIITKTMINNYTKEKVLPPPVKKKYSRRRLIEFILIYFMKPVLSIADIRKLLNNGKREFDLNRLYGNFTALQKDYDMSESLNAALLKIDSIESEDDNQLLLFVLYLIIEANMRKQLAERIIDRHFTEAKQ